LARQLRKHPETEHAVLAAVSGYGQEQDRAMSREAGFDYHFMKPIHAEQLAELLNRLGQDRPPAA
jgi:CheY-like chemotaxis protein